MYDLLERFLQCKDSSFFIHACANATVKHKRTIYQLKIKNKMHAQSQRDKLWMLKFYHPLSTGMPIK